MIRQPISKKLYVVLATFAIAAMLLGYTWLSYRQHVRNPDDRTIPTWSQLAKGMEKAFIQVDDMERHRIFSADFVASMDRLLWGLGVSILGAVLLGLYMGCYARVKALLYLPLSLLAKIPPTAALAIFFVMVGTEFPMYVTMIAFGIMPTLTLAIYLAAKEVADELLHKGYTLGASNHEATWNIIFPNILPKIIDAVMLAIGPAIVYLIAAEMLVSDIGFGYRIRLEAKKLNMDIVYPYLASLTLIGYSMNYLLRITQQSLCQWYAPRDRWLAFTFRLLHRLTDAAVWLCMTVVRRLRGASV